MSRSVSLFGLTVARKDKFSPQLPVIAEVREELGFSGLIAGLELCEKEPFIHRRNTIHGDAVWQILDSRAFIDYVEKNSHCFDSVSSGWIPALSAMELKPALDWVIFAR